MLQTKGLSVSPQRVQQEALHHVNFGRLSVRFIWIRDQQIWAFHRPVCICDFMLAGSSDYKNCEMWNDSIISPLFSQSATLAFHTTMSSQSKMLENHYFDKNNKIIIAN